MFPISNLAQQAVRADRAELQSPTRICLCTQDADIVESVVEAGKSRGKKNARKLQATEVVAPPVAVTPAPLGWASPGLLGVGAAVAAGLAAFKVRQHSPPAAPRPTLFGKICRIELDTSQRVGTWGGGLVGGG